MDKSFFPGYFSQFSAKMAILEGEMALRTVQCENCNSNVVILDKMRGQPSLYE